MNSDDVEEIEEVEVDTEVEPIVDLVAQELALLKSRADQMGVRYHPSIGLVKLKEKLNAKFNEKPEKKPVADEPVVNRVIMGARVADVTESVNRRNMRLRKESSRLIRVNLTCMNPAKSSWEGEIFTISNSAIGTFKKYVAFNTTDGWHVPQIILNMIKEREFQVFYKEKTSRGEVNRSKLAKEFAIDILPQLTRTEIKDLAKKQAMANNLG